MLTKVPIFCFPVSALSHDLEACRFMSTSKSINHRKYMEYITVQNKTYKTHACVFQMLSCAEMHQMLSCTEMHRRRMMQTEPVVMAHNAAWCLDFHL